MGFFESNKIKFGEILSQTQEFLTKSYKQARTVFTSASPFGQILQVLASYSQLFFLYLEDALVEMNILTATKEKSIFGWSRLTGHNPTRALSAQGTLKIKLKPGITSDFNFSYVMILEESKLLCENNGLPYFIQLGNALGSIKIASTSNDFTTIRLIQGEVETQTRRGTGDPMQSFTLTAKKPIDNENVYVEVNGEPYEIVDSLYDMPKDSKLCLVKTGISGGIDVYFGNEDYGTMPSKGSIIKVKYVLSDGYAGNILSKSDQIKFKWSDKGYTNIGDEIDLNEIFLTSVEKPIMLGADSEDVNLTKVIAPNTSRSYVLANPNNYVSFLSRFNYSYIDAYTTFGDDFIDDDNVIYLFMLPDVSRRVNSSSDYFKTALTNFYIGEDEKQAIYNYVNQSGRQMIGTELEIVDPILTRYALNVFLRIYDTADANTLKNEVISKLTDYLIKVNRRDKIPKSDLIAIIEAIPGIDSVNLSFVSEKNEKAIIDGFYYKQRTVNNDIRGIQEVIQQKVMVGENEDPNLGLDDFGDVKIGLNERPVVRGGWYDRFGNYYQDGIDFNQYSSVNIIIKEVIKETVSTKMMNKNKSNL